MPGPHGSASMLAAKAAGTGGDLNLGGSISITRTNPVLDGVVASEVALLDSHIIYTDGIESKHAAERLKEGI